MDEIMLGDTVMWQGHSRSNLMLLESLVLFVTSSSACTVQSLFNFVLCVLSVSQPRVEGLASFSPTELATGRSRNDCKFVEEPQYPEQHNDSDLQSCSSYNIASRE